jgi:hypothetical protein
MSEIPAITVSASVPPLSFTRSQLSGPARPAGPTLAQLGRKLQQPRQTVGPLETFSAWPGQVCHFGGNADWREMLIQPHPRFVRPSRIREQSQQAREQPVPMYRGVPVEAAVKRGRQLPRRPDVGIAVQEMQDVIGEFS